MNTIGYFEIQSSNPEREINFYTTIFGWKFIREEHLSITYYRIETHNLNGGLLLRPAATPPTKMGTNAYVCSIQVENFDDMSKLILKNGGQIALAKFAIKGRCWQGYFIDQDHNTFGLFEVDDNAS